MITEEEYIKHINHKNLKCDNHRTGLEMELNEFRRRSEDHEKFVHTFTNHTGEVTTKRNNDQIVINKLSKLSGLSIRRTRDLFEELQRMLT